MWNNTRITRLLGIDYPILQGPMGGGFSTVELLTKVSEAGGLGSYGAYTLTADELKIVGKEIKSRTSKPFNINLWVSDVDSELQDVTPQKIKEIERLYKPYFDELSVELPTISAQIPSKFESQMEVLFEIRPSVFSFIFGIPSPEILSECKKLGIATVGGATTLDEALALEEAGVNAVIAAGFEAGGHRPSFLKAPDKSFMGLFTLIQQIKAKSKLPIIAAGGIMDGTGIGAALRLGADAVQLGTAFLACKESNATALHRQLLFSKAAENTVVSKSLTGRMGRMLDNQIANDIPNTQEVLPFPLQLRFLASLKEAAIKQGRTDLASFWAGQGAPLLQYTDVSKLMNALISEAGKSFN